MVSQEPDDRTSSRVVLLVEPEREVRNVLQEILEQRGYDVLAANDGRMARASIAATRPDIALIEVMLRDESGADLSEELVGSGLPVVAMTGHSEGARLLESLPLWRLTKPFGGDALVMLIQQVLAGPHLRPEEVRP
ncbi:MAG: two component transcriptional regulator, winged helix family [Rhodospirillales bacterium]|jgi:DNA-binding response OmpR family regulator|nr:two component transcriptional regulator, winged helix family [Rhodospirillales bacterium]